MKQQTMVAMMATNRRMDEAMPAKVVGLRGEEEQDLSCRAFLTLIILPRAVPPPLAECDSL